MAIIGAQHETASDAAAVQASRSTLSNFLTSPKSNTPPSFHEWASVTDNMGFYNISALAYWPSKAAYESWADQSGFRAWWQGLDCPEEESSNGWFIEVFLPTTDRFETLFNNDTAREGAAHMGRCMSEEVREHGYWGSMRDRIPLAQTDGLAGAGTLLKASSPPDPNSVVATTTTTTTRNRVVVPGRKNLAVIRSGQDWLDTTPEERTLYLDTMHPVLIKGMDFLRDYGDEIGCYSCRFMEIVDSKTARPDGIDRTFGLAYFDELASLERWCREHPTHLAIFGGFFKYAKKLDNHVTLRVFHEVMVLQPDQQYFEYVGCHPGTGMLATVDRAGAKEEI
ncbi:heme-containing dehydratase protein [Apodospora peruviana]|uniref:Heme-containing dehydratase protein n=1 Tax=Apodospora peruviana TaxID=516989 RepID=A0AAE0HZE9_9PEZI|nr:heme-containing dehydratase protein [Apodospora peruviana]